MAEVNAQLIIDTEGFDFGVLKKVCKEFNSKKILEKPIRTTARSKENIVTDFVEAVEIIPEKSEEDKLMPENAKLLYNEYGSVLDGESMIINFKQKKGGKEMAKEEMAESKKKEKKEGTKKTGVGIWIVERLKNGEFDGLSNEQIAEKARNELGSKTQPGNIPGYRYTAKTGIKHGERKKAKKEE